MNYLLDTHSFLWSLFTPGKLSKKASAAVLNSDKSVYVSIVTFWEISLKYNLGKLILKNVYPDELPEIAQQSGFEIFNLNETDVSTFYKLPRIRHGDPFDRLLIWQGIRNNLTVISKDGGFEEYGRFGLKILW